MTDAPVLVIGAIGKTSCLLTSHLRDACVVHSAGVRRAGSGSGSPEVRFDWDAPDSWPLALSGIRRLHFTKPPSDRDPAVGVRALLESQESIERIVILSEILREGKPDTEPHRAVERLLDESDVESVILRPNWFMQNWSAGGGFWDSIALRYDVVLPSAEARAALIDVRDVVDVALLALTSGGPLPVALELTGPESISMADLASAICAVAGRPITHRSSSLDEVRGEMLAGGVNHWQVDLLMDLLSDFRTGRSSRVTNAVESIFGRPARSLESFVADHAGDWQIPTRLSAQRG